MERKRSFYGRVSPAILKPFSTPEADGKTTPEGLQIRDSNRLSDDIKNTTKATNSEKRPPTPLGFHYSFNPRLLDIQQPAASSNPVGPFPSILTAPVLNPLHNEARVYGEKRECVICAEEKGPRAFTRVTARCGHYAGTCSGCVMTSIRSDLNNKRWTEITCPECDEKLEYGDVHRSADHSTFERWVSTRRGEALTTCTRYLLTCSLLIL